MVEHLKEREKRTVLNQGFNKRKKSLCPCIGILFSCHYRSFLSFNWSGIKKKKNKDLPDRMKERNDDRRSFSLSCPHVLPAGNTMVWARLLDDLFLSYGQHQDSPLKERRNGESKGVTIRRSSARERRERELIMCRQLMLLSSARSRSSSRPKDKLLFSLLTTHAFLERK